MSPLNFNDLFKHPYLIRRTINSLVVAGTVASVQILLCTLAGYAIAKRQFPGARSLFMAYVASMMIPSR